MPESKLKIGLKNAPTTGEITERYKQGQVCIQKSGNVLKKPCMISLLQIFRARGLLSPRLPSQILLGWNSLERGSSLQDEPVPVIQDCQHLSYQSAHSKEPKGPSGPLSSSTDMLLLHLQDYSSKDQSATSSPFNVHQGLKVFSKAL